MTYYVHTAKKCPEESKVQFPLYPKVKDKDTFVKNVGGAGIDDKSGYYR